MLETNVKFQYPTQQKSLGFCFVPKIKEHQPGFGSCGVTQISYVTRTSEAAYANNAGIIIHRWSVAVARNLSENAIFN